MDPNFIHVDWERAFDAIMLVAIVAIIVERSLSVLFQNRVYIERFHKAGMKETIALGVSVAVCVVWKLDVMGMIVLTGSTTAPGYIITGALVAGGSKGSLKLFQNFFNLQSSAFKIRHAIEADKAAADAERAQAEAEAAPNKATAEMAKVKAAAAVRRAKIAAAEGAADGESVPGATLAAADSALKGAIKAVELKPE